MQWKFIILCYNFFLLGWVKKNQKSGSIFFKNNRGDTVLQEIFDIKRLPSQSTYSRFFHKFSWEKNDEIFATLQQKFLSQIDVGALTIDLDSSVITRYGVQEGAKKGYNPKKRGRNSHHPLIAFIDQTKMVANAWMRSGNTSDLNNYKAFLNETFDVALNPNYALKRTFSTTTSQNPLKIGTF